MIQKREKYNMRRKEREKGVCKRKRDRKMEGKVNEKIRDRKEERMIKKEKDK